MATSSHLQVCLSVFATAEYTLMTVSGKWNCKRGTVQDLFVLLRKCIVREPLSFFFVSSNYQTKTKCSTMDVIQWKVKFIEEKKIADTFIRYAMPFEWIALKSVHFHPNKRKKNQEILKFRINNFVLLFVLFWFFSIYHYHEQSLLILFYKWIEEEKKASRIPCLKHISFCL